nr:hypothetical protein [Tanacetum cinerariifolium]
MARLAFYDYHNMIAILEKYEHNHDFHQILDFVEASHIRYALTINPIVYVSHIRQFWSIARIETTHAKTKILATVDGKPRTISESSIRRNLILNDEAGISSLPDAELFENLTLMGYNISPNQKFTFQKGKAQELQLSPITHPLLRHHNHHNMNFHHHPFHLLSVKQFPLLYPLIPPLLRQYTKRAKRIAQSTALPTVVDEPASPLRDDNIDGLQDCSSGFRNFSVKARVKLLEDKDGGGTEPSGDDATIKGRSLATGEEAGERGMVSVPPAVEVATVSVPTGSGLVPTASPIFTSASVVTPYTRCKGKEKMIARDAEIARIHAEEELQMLIDGLDRKNKVIARHLHDYEQASADLSIGEKIELINEPGMSLEEIREKFILVWKQIQDFVPMASKEEGERVKRKVEEVYVEALQLDREDMIQLWTLMKETLSIRQSTRDKEKELWVELKRLFEPDVEDQLWTHTQALMYDPVEWRLYDFCGVHHVLSRDQEIFILVERDYPLRKRLVIVMIRNKLQVENYS